MKVEEKYNALQGMVNGIVYFYLAYCYCFRWLEKTCHAEISSDKVDSSENSNLLFFMIRIVK